MIDSVTEELFFSVAEARRADMVAHVVRLGVAFDDGPWPRMTHAERAGWIRALGAGMQARTDDLGQLWPRESGVLHSVAQYSGMMASGALESYAALADTFPFEEECPADGRWRLRPVGARAGRRGRRDHPVELPVTLIAHKIGPALLAGCTVILKSSPEAPGEGYVFAEVAEEIGLPPGVLNV